MTCFWRDGWVSRRFWSGWALWGETCPLGDGELKLTYWAPTVWPSEQDMIARDGACQSKERVQETGIWEQRDQGTKHTCEQYTPLLPFHSGFLRVMCSQRLIPKVLFKGTSRCNEEKMNNGKDIFTKDKRRLLNPWTKDTHTGEVLQAVGSFWVFLSRWSPESNARYVVIKGTGHLGLAHTSRRYIVCLSFVPNSTPTFIAWSFFRVLTPSGFSPNCPLPSERGATHFSTTVLVCAHSASPLVQEPFPLFCISSFSSLMECYTKLQMTPCRCSHEHAKATELRSPLLLENKSAQ